MKLPPFKCRCSSIGAMMTNPRSSGRELSETCIAVIEDWVKRQVYQKEKPQVRSKYFEKGIKKEGDSIDLCASQFRWLGAVKNEEWFENEYFTGTPDVITATSVEDIKNAFDCFTFPLFDTVIPPKMKGYDFQLRGYMSLTGKQKAGLCYTLMDAPESVIDREAYIRRLELGLDETPAELYDEVKAEMSYEHLDPKIRVKRFEIKSDLIILSQMQTRVIECREYIDKYIQPKIIHL